MIQPMDPWWAGDLRCTSSKASAGSGRVGETTALDKDRAVIFLSGREGCFEG